MLPQMVCDHELAGVVFFLPFCLSRAIKKRYLELCKKVKKGYRDLEMADDENHKQMSTSWS